MQGLLFNTVYNEIVLKTNCCYCFCLSDKPTIELRSNQHSDLVERGSYFFVHAFILANPPYTSLVWLKNSEEVVGFRGIQLTETAGIDYDTVYECIVNNTLGSSTDNVQVTVHCKYCQITPYNEDTIMLSWVL